MSSYKLNEKQNTAVCHFKGPMLVLAGPGSGKTTVIIHRVKKLITKFKVSPHHILVITFTKSAATEMAQRFHRLKLPESKYVTFGTFHAIFYRILRSAYGYGLDCLLNEDEKWNFIKTACRDLSLEYNDEEEYIKTFFSALSLAKNNLESLSSYVPESMKMEEFQILTKQYEAYKSRVEKIDYDDMLVQCHELLESNTGVLSEWQKRYPFILVDEFQDINNAQYQCIKLLAGKEKNLFAVGDDDQSIYKFRGANPEFLLGFPAEFEGCKNVVLDINYRSTEKIIQFSQAVIRNNHHRFEKNICGQGLAGKSVVLFRTEDSDMQALKIAEHIKTLHQQGTAYQDIAILFRTNLEAAVFTRVLFANAIPYTLKDTIMDIYSHWIAKDITAYIKLALDLSDNASLLRVINKPTRYISKALVDAVSQLRMPLMHAFYSHPQAEGRILKQITNLMQHLKQIGRRTPYEAVKYILTIVNYNSYIEEFAIYRKANTVGLFEIADEILHSAKNIKTLQEFESSLQRLSQDLKENKRNDLGNDGVALSTLHSAKGLEYNTVFIPSLNENILPHEKSKSPEEIEEERRLFYVGITRAREQLYISQTLTKNETKSKPSLFLKELGIEK